MKKNNFIFYLLFFVTIFSISCKSEKEFVQKDFLIDENSRSRVFQELRNNFPKQTFLTYWNASLRGNVKIIKKITSFPPKDIFQDCVGNKTEIENAPLPRKIVPNKNKPENPTKNIFLAEDIPEEISLESMSIFESKINFERVKIENKKIYKTEAIMFVSKLNENGLMEDPLTDELVVFFKKTEKGWKIVGIPSRAKEFSDLNNINYAKPRPKCSKLD